MTDDLLDVLSITDVILPSFPLKLMRVNMTGWPPQGLNSHFNWELQMRGFYPCSYRKTYGNTRVFTANTDALSLFTARWGVQRLVHPQDNIRKRKVYIYMYIKCVCVRLHDRWWYKNRVGISNVSHIFLIFLDCDVSGTMSGNRGITHNN